MEINVSAGEGLFGWSFLLIAIPLVISFALLLLGKAADSWGHWLGLLGPLAAFGLGTAIFLQLLGDPQAVVVSLYDWMTAGSWTISAGLLIDQLSILFVLLVTGVGSLIFVYSVGYMAHDEGRRRFFAYLNLFVAAMLLLVLAENYFLLFMGWEGVGLASYLLIGFWQHKKSAALAAKKAFLVNRVGDLGLAMAIFTLLAHLGNVSFLEVTRLAPELSDSAAMWIGLFLLLAACGKSAQVPLQSWLMDAMEGPTPVSALIHAATMVTAGVYLVVRSHAIYALSDVAATAVVIVGTVTLFAGAWIGSTKDDIKKVLAGSTMSQIGYMMLAAGLGPVGAAFAIFHLLTHGAFKANMFLGAGSVMHGMGDDVNLRHFGALRKFMPYTFWTFACGYLAIIGFPFLSGYFSKDHIIEAAFERSTVIGVLAIIGAGITAFYMTRLMMMAFFGEARWTEKPHDSPAVMVFPLVVLAILSVGLGAAMNNWIQGWLAPATGHIAHEASLLHFSMISGATLAVVLAGVIVGYLLYNKQIAYDTPEKVNPIVAIGRNELYANQINEWVFMRPGEVLVSGLDWFDSRIVDGCSKAMARSVSGAGGWLRKVQNGQVRSYGTTMLVGVLLIGLVLFIGRMF